MVANCRPLYHHIQFRCSRCRKTQTRVLEHHGGGGSRSSGKSLPTELSETEAGLFAALGRITTDEEIEFAQALNRTAFLKLPLN